MDLEKLRQHAHSVADLVSANANSDEPHSLGQLAYSVQAFMDSLLAELQDMQQALEACRQPKPSGHESAP